MAFQIFRDEVVRGVLRADIVDSQKIWVADGAEDARFLFKAEKAVGIGSQRFRQDLDGHGAIESRVARKINFAHAPGTERRENFIGPQLGGISNRHASELYPRMRLRTKAARNWFAGGLPVTTLTRELKKCRNQASLSLLKQTLCNCGTRYNSFGTHGMSNQGWIVQLVLLLVGTATVWFRARHIPSTRPWLVRHLVGNFILVIGLVAAWRFDLAPTYYVAIVVGVFVMWMWGTRKLRHSVQKNN